MINLPMRQWYYDTKLGEMSKTQDNRRIGYKIQCGFFCLVCHGKVAGDSSAAADSGAGAGTPPGGAVLPVPVPVAIRRHLFRLCHQYRGH